MLSLNRHTNHFKRSLIMKRFAGMMPNEEIKKEKHYKCEDGTIIAQAGPNGWTVIWADHGTNYKDTVATTEENFQTALKIIEHYFPGLTGNDFDGRAEADAKYEKFKTEYIEGINDLMHRLYRDFHVVASMIKEYPSKEYYFKRRDEEHLALPYEDKEFLTSRKYNKMRAVILSMSHEEFLVKLKEQFIDAMKHIKEYDRYIEHMKDMIRFYDALPCSMAIKIAFSENYGALSSVYSNVESLIRKQTDMLEHEAKFHTRVEFDIANGYRRYRIKDDNNDPESYRAVLHQVKHEVEEYFKNEIMPKIEEKLGPVDQFNTLVDTTYSSERIIYPDGSTEED